MKKLFCNFDAGVVLGLACLFGIIMAMMILAGCDSGRVTPQTPVDVSAPPVNTPQAACSCVGEDGLPGLDGKNGADGQTGAQGTKGDTGATGEQGPIGATGAQGEAGLQGPMGIPGVQGLMGLTGPQGAVGPAGVNCTVAIADNFIAVITCGNTRVAFLGLAGCMPTDKPVCENDTTLCLTTQAEYDQYVAHGAIPGKCHHDCDHD